MVFIPAENIEKFDYDKTDEVIIWTLLNGRVRIYFYHTKTNDWQTFIHAVQVYKKDLIGTIADFKILKCSELACQSRPQLHYNKIIHKWFCECPSSLVCTKDTDEDEIKHYKEECNIKDFTEENGFFDSPLKAICNWQKSMAESYIDIANEALKIENEEK